MHIIVFKVNLNRNQKIEYFFNLNYKMYFYLNHKKPFNHITNFIKQPINQKSQIN